MSALTNNAYAGMSPTRSSAVAEELRRLILAGELPPGTRLRQVEIAERFGVSTTPVREALTALAKQGLVRHDAQRGVVVFSPTVQDVDENYEIRIVLEPLATQIAVPRISPEELIQLEEIVEGMRAADDVATYQALNRDFHFAIYKAAGRSRLFGIIQELRDAAASYLKLDATARPDPAYDHEVHHQHEEIFEAIRNRAAKRAAKLMRQHLEYNRQHVITSVEKVRGE